MAARPCKGRASNVEDEGPTAYELQREERIRQNRAKMVALGILEQKSLLEAGFRALKKTTTLRKEKTKVEPARSSSRLAGALPEYMGLAEDYAECHEGRLELPKTGVMAEKAWVEVVKERRCDNQGRGSLYDSKAGITCHFCRQKKLCGEPDCPRCTERNTDKACLGKSECSRCGTANGRFCRACLQIRYGYKLEKVRQDMEAGIWLCPHCYEEEHPHKGWICNSSICMTRRGLKPTGIAIYDAQARGFQSVAHFLQARLRMHQQDSTLQAEPQPDQKNFPEPVVGAVSETAPSVPARLAPEGAPKQQGASASEAKPGEPSKPAVHRSNKQASTDRLASAPHATQVTLRSTRSRAAARREC